MKTFNKLIEIGRVLLGCGIAAFIAMYVINNAWPAWSSTNMWLYTVVILVAGFLGGLIDANQDKEHPDMDWRAGH